MPSSSDAAPAGLPPEALALLEKIEELSLLRALSDRFAAAVDFAGACDALTELVWEARGAVGVAYVAIELAAPSAAVESLTPPGCALDALRSPALLARLATAVAALAAPDPVRLDAASSWIPGAAGALLWAPTWLRGTLTGGVVVHTTDEGERVASDLRLLAIVAAMAALGLDAARMQAREDFLATLRHDIKNPVDAALGYLEIIDDRLVEQGLPDLRAYVAAAGESLKAVDDLVVNYLHLAVIDRALPLVGRAEFDLTALVAEVVERFRPAAARRSVTLTGPRGSIGVSADRLQLARVVTNLVDNAVKYMPGPGRVEVEVLRGRDEVLLAVRDTGRGLSPEEAGRLFRKHGRLGADARVAGSGLGLYLSKAIVEAHGGAIQVASTPGAGTTFVVRLPAPARPAATPTAQAAAPT